MEKTWSWSVTGYNFVGGTHEEIRELCGGAGFAGIEGAPELFAEQTGTELQQIAAEYGEAGLAIDTFHLPFGADDDIASFYEVRRAAAADKAKHWVERASALGVKVAVQHPSTSRFNVDVDGLDQYLRQLGRSLEFLLPAAQTVDVIIALENMLPGDDGGRICSRPEHFERIIREFGHANLGFCLDTGHALVSGGPGGAEAIAEAMGSHLVAYHLADNAGDRDSHLAPGHGLVDWGPVFRRAAKLKYSLNMCIETPPFAAGPRYSPAAWRALATNVEELSQAALST